MASMETDIGGPANVRVCGREQSCEYSRTMRSPYEEFASASAAVDETDHTLPYHAREDSQPFSYGKIGQTSTPLKDGRATHDKYRGVWEDIDPRTNRNRNHFESNSYKYNTYNGSSNNYNSNNSNTLGRSSAQAGPEPSTIKAQPRLTSPLLVRKTLNSGSPTRNSTNTIANTYHYSYNSSSGGGSNGDINKYSFNNNNNNNNNNYSSNNNKNNYNYNTNTIGHTNNSNHNNNINNNNNNSLRSKTPTRNDFEELLRERRERVYNEYRSTTTTRETPSPSKQRQQLSTSSLSSSGAHAPNGQNKYNFDFEFNLNLDDLPPRRSNTMERSSLQYRTHDIPVVTSVERNYHTISSSKAREPAVAWQERGRDRERPPLEASYGRRFRQEATTTTLDRYGNENAAGYRYGYGGGNEGSGAGGQNRNAADNMSPIYATSSKQRQMQATAMTTTTTTRSYRGSQLDVNRGEPELSITDYASAMLSSPTSGAAPLVSRPETPAFPVTPRTPYGANNNNGYNAPPHLPQSPTPRRAADSQMPEAHNYSSETIYQTNANRARLNSSLSLANSEPQEVAPHLVKFAKDSSKFWYKPGLSREEAIALLLHAAPGTFVVRDSTTYKSAYGLVVRVAQPPPGSASGKQDELVRHFLIEPTTRGVRLKGCANEPVFTSLSALVYEHSINALALPCPLLIPEHDLVPPLVEHTPAQKQLLTQGAACHVLWLYSCDTESLTGEEAIRKAIRQLYAQQPPPAPTEVNFKVSQQGITLTDNTRKKFFRKHYVADMISYCAIDPDHRTWTWTQEENGAAPLKKTIFAFVARRSPSSKDNQCHVFCDLAINQPASAIVSFANKTLPTEKLQNYVL